MAKMTDEDLLALLKAREDDAADFGTILASERRDATRAYYRQPYGNELLGWSQIVTAEVRDAVEWILPAIIEKFVSNDRAVEFEPTRAEDEQGAAQATDGCNYVFYKQNNGFLILYTALKDALIQKNGAIHWRAEDCKEVTYETQQAPKVIADAMASQAPEGISVDIQREFQVADPMTGQAVPFCDVRIGTTRTVKRIKVEAFDPNDLLIPSDWTSPLLDECPYVCRVMEVTLSDLRKMGFKADKVSASDLAASGAPLGEEEREQFRGRRGNTDVDGDDPSISANDESQTRGYIRIEWVLVDVDGDDIAERRQIIRLDSKILSNETFPEVPVCTGSPILVQHHWDGMSVAELMEDLQRLGTELTRGIVNNSFSSNNPRKIVLTDTNGAPFANVDDLLNSSPGGLLRQTRPDAIGIEPTAYVGNQMMPLLDMVDQMGTRRTGVGKQQQGLDPNSIRTDKTAQEAVLMDSNAQRIVNLMSRLCGETMLKPAFRGILRLLTQGGFEPLMFRLRGEYVKLDPNEWRDGYDMTVNVGLGTGDEEKRKMLMGQVSNMQMQLMQAPPTRGFVTPEQFYNTLAELVSLGGEKDVGQFFTKPPENAPWPSPPPPPPPESVLVAQIKAQADIQKAQLEAGIDAQKVAFEQQIKDREQANEAAIQRANDERDAQREALNAQYQNQLEAMRIELDRYKVDQDNRTKIITARIAHPEGEMPDVTVDPLTGEMAEKNPMAALTEAVWALIEQNNGPKMILRDEMGRAVGVQAVPRQTQ